MSFVLLSSLSAPSSPPGECPLPPSRMGEPRGHQPLLLWGLAQCLLIRDGQGWLVASNPGLLLVPWIKPLGWA